MMLGLAEILAIPPAMSSIFDIIRAIKTRKVHEDPGRDIAELERQLQEIMERLSGFSRSRIEAQVWKEIHHITNHVQSRLGYTLRAHARGKSGFTGADVGAKEVMKNEVRSLKDSGAPILQIKILVSNKEVIAAAVLPSHIYGGDGSWWDFLLEKFSDLETHLEDENMGNAYDTLVRIRELVLYMNYYGDEKLRETIGDFINVMEKLSSDLKLCSS